MNAAGAAHPNAPSDPSCSSHAHLLCPQSPSSSTLLARHCSCSLNVVTSRPPARGNWIRGGRRTGPARRAANAMVVEELNAMLGCSSSVESVMRLGQPYGSPANRRPIAQRGHRECAGSKPSAQRKQADPRRALACPASPTLHDHLIQCLRTLFVGVSTFSMSTNRDF